VVRIQTLVELIAEEVLGGGVAQVPLLDGVEPEVVLAVGAEGDGLLALVVDVAGAVVPQTNEVEVLEVLGTDGSLQGL
jgi:hypothetical protein